MKRPLRDVPRGPQLAVFEFSPYIPPFCSSLLLLLVTSSTTGSLQILCLVRKRCEILFSLAGRKVVQPKSRLPKGCYKVSIWPEMFCAYSSMYLLYIV